MVVLPGHRLEENGAAYGKGGCTHLTCLVHGAVRLRMEMNPDGGHARCSCGALSPHLSSNRERRAWHRKHKDEVAGDGHGAGA